MPGARHQAPVNKEQEIYCEKAHRDISVCLFQINQLFRIIWRRAPGTWHRCYGATAPSIFSASLRSDDVIPPASCVESVIVTFV